MKRIICFVLAAIVGFTVCGLIVGCADTSGGTGTAVNATGYWSGNVSKGGWGNYQYNHICIIAGDDHQCYEVEKWWDNELAGLEIKIRNGGYIFASEGTYHIYSQSSDCKFCK